MGNSTIERFVYTPSGKNLIVRQSPKTNGNTIGSLPNGTKVLMVTNTDIKNSYAKISYPIVGYVDYRYLRLAKVTSKPKTEKALSKSERGLKLKNVHHGDIINMQNQSWYDCWIDNYVTGEHIVLPQTPVGWGENYSANFANQDIIGSSRPRLMYTGTSLRTMSFSLQNLTRDYLPSPFESLTEYVHKLQSLCFPEYNASGVITAPDCHLQLGERGFQGVFTSINVTWGDEVYNSGDNYRLLGGDKLTKGINKTKTGSYSEKKWQINGGERIRCNIDFAFTNTRINQEIPGATTISLRG